MKRGVGAFEEEEGAITGYQIQWLCKIPCSGAIYLSPNNWHSNRKGQLLPSYPACGDLYSIWLCTVEKRMLDKLVLEPGSSSISLDQWIKLWSGFVQQNNSYSLK